MISGVEYLFNGPGRWSLLHRLGPLDKARRAASSGADRPRAHMVYLLYMCQVTPGNLFLIVRVLLGACAGKVNFYV